MENINEEWPLLSAQKKQIACVHIHLNRFHFFLAYVCKFDWDLNMLVYYCSLLLQFIQNFIKSCRIRNCNFYGQIQTIDEPREKSEQDVHLQRQKKESTDSKGVLVKIGIDSQISFDQF